VAQCISKWSLSLRFVFYLCLISHVPLVGRVGRRLCLKEHQDESDDEIIGCCFIARQHFVLPSKYRKYGQQPKPTPRQQNKRRRNEADAPCLTEQKKRRRNEADALAIEGEGAVTVSRYYENPAPAVRRTPRLTANTTVSYRD